jgi:ribosome-binding factor A
VSVSPDLRDAQIFISVMPEKYEKRSLSGLRHAAGHIQALVGKSMAMKVIPRLDFRLDESIKKEAGVLGAIRRALEREKAEDAVKSDDAADATGDSGDASGGTSGGGGDASGSTE